MLFYSSSIGYDVYHNQIKRRLNALDDKVLKTYWIPRRYTFYSNIGAPYYLIILSAVQDNLIF